MTKPRPRRSPIWTLPEQEFRDLVARSTTYTAVLGHFGLENKGGNWRTLQQRLGELGITVDHFEGKHVAGGRASALAPEVVLVENSPHQGSVAKRKFKALGSVPYTCEECGQGDTWRGRPLVLILDHRNGKNRDHRPENLRWICPNCDSQSETFCGRNQRPDPSV